MKKPCDTGASWRKGQEIRARANVYAVFLFPNTWTAIHAIRMGSVGISYAWEVYVMQIQFGGACATWPPGITQVLFQKSYGVTEVKLITLTDSLHGEKERKLPNSPRVRFWMGRNRVDPWALVEFFGLGGLCSWVQSCDQYRHLKTPKPPNDRVTQKRLKSDLWGVKPPSYSKRVRSDQKVTENPLFESLLTLF